MRILFLLLFILYNTTSLLSQAPSAKEIEAQKKEAINEAKQQVADLKKDIAEAKAKKEDPESIQEMEKQLATLESMVAMLGKTSLPGKQRSMESLPPKTVDPKYFSPFTPIVLKQPVSIPTEKEATDQLFWYKGKKVDANTLMTTKGMIIQYDRKNHQLIIQPEKTDTPYYGLVRSLSLMDQTKKEFVVEMDKTPNAFFMYPEIQRAYDEFNNIRDRYYGLAKNKIDVPVSNGNLGIEQHLQYIISYINNLPNIMDIELPPKRPNYLCGCDPDADNKNFQESLDQWVRTFYQEELLLYDKMVGLYDLRETLKNKQGASYKDPANLSETADNAFTTIFERMMTKYRKLRKKYDAGDIDVEDGLVHAALVRKIRTEAISSSSNQDHKTQVWLAEQDFEICKNIVFSDIFDQQIKKFKADKNFPEVFNYARYLSHEYNKNHLDPSYKVNENFYNIWMEGLKKYNRFTLILKMNFNFQGISKDEHDPFMIANGKLESDKIIVSIGVEDCKLNLHITDVIYGKSNISAEEEFKIPIKVVGGEKDYLTDDLPPFKYAGPPTMGMIFPRFKLNFCGDESEVKMDLLTYKPSEWKKHSGDNVAKTYTVDMHAHSNKLFQGVLKTAINMDDLIKTGGNMMDMSGPQMQVSTGNPVLDQFKADYLMNKKRYDLQYSLANTTLKDKTVLNLGKLSGRTSTVIQKTFDMSDNDDKWIVFQGNVIIELTHTPK